jgi:signal transduction histidine kinase
MTEGLHHYGGTGGAVTSLRRRYESFIWWTMDAVGMSGSVRRKVLLAVGIQFAVSVAQVVVPLYASGTLRVAGVGFLLVLATVAFANTVLVVERDFVEPTVALQEAATSIARGDLDADLRATDQQDEIWDLVRAFADMCGHLSVVAQQAEALAAHEFDAPVLDRELPGRFGESLRGMTMSLHHYIDRVEAERSRSRLLNYLVSHDLPNVINIVYGRLDLARAATSDPEVVEHLDVVGQQAAEIEEVCDMVGKLTDDDGADDVDAAALLRDEVARVRESFPAATVHADVPDGECRVRGNALLSSVFTNLVTNGIEHNDSAEPTVEVALTERESEVVVRVADDGPGLDVGDADTFFETRDTGTGLDIVYTSVTQFGGRIDVRESALGGTEFEVVLPRAGRSASPEPVRAAE